MVKWLSISHDLLDKHYIILYPHKPDLCNDLPESRIHAGKERRLPRPVGIGRPWQWSQ